MKMRLALVPLLAAIVLGCGDGATLISDPVEVKGRVLFASGKPVTDVRLNINPMDRGLPGAAKLGSDGKFGMSLVPGKYNYSFEPLEGKMGALKALPDKYHSPQEEHTIDVVAGQEITITVK